MTFSDETAELRRRLAETEAELKSYRSKNVWLQAALTTERHGRQMLEATVSARYQAAIAGISDAVRFLIPDGATVLVISKGDQELMLSLGNRRAWHFPQSEDGSYAGYYPRDSAAAIAHLQSLIAKGGQFLLVPNTAFWWLEHYRDLAEWLAKVHTPVWQDERFAIYKLSHEGVEQPTVDSTTSATQWIDPGFQPEPHFGKTAVPTATEDYNGQDHPSLRKTRVPCDVESEKGECPVILCFPIIDWAFRFQRPQQLMLQFAHAGCRVFYLSHQFRKSGEPYLLRPLATDLWELSLLGPRFNPHQQLLDEVHCDKLAESLSVLRRDHIAEGAVAIVQSPFWWPLVKQVAPLFRWPTIYDCMDHHAGFATGNPVLLEQEHQLLSQADLVVASSGALEQQAHRYNRNVLLVRNGCEYEHFAAIRAKHPGPRPVIGYYGAIADWFDSDLVADLAERRPDWDFLLVGSTFSADLTRLATLPNVTFTGEKPYAELPDWLARFDVAILPFKRTPLTEAANPVKVYEIFAGGKPLVSVPLPEIVPLAPLARLAATADEFEREIEAELDRSDSKEERERRKFARANTWRQRFNQIWPIVQDLAAQPNGYRQPP
jgi:glycosyltransferase involved in cell wall biosynthesis